MKFRKKPVIIDALQFTGAEDDWFRIGEFCGQCAQIAKEYGKSILLISTLEGTMKADEGDWIIRGVKGEFYPCKPDIFEATYEPIQEVKG